jgi:RHS repeat-associated protein
MPRFGYNGMLKDNDFKGEGNSYDYGARWYDPRVARFLSVDPIAKEFAYKSNYTYSDNNPIVFKDLDGKVGDNPITDYMISRDGIARSDLSESKKNELYKMERSSTIKGSMYSTIAFGISLTVPYAYPYAVPAAYTLMRLDPDGSKTAGTILGLTDPNPGADYPGFMDDVGRFVGQTFRYGDNKFFKLVTESNSGWSKNAKSYQEAVTGLPAGYALEVNGVKFDGIKNGVLQDAKSGMQNFVDKSTGKFKKFFTETGAKELIDQARRQYEAAGGTKIQWHFENKEVMNATQQLFEDVGIKGIELKHTPRDIQN